MIEEVSDLLLPLIWGAGIADFIWIAMSMMNFFRIAAFFTIVGVCLALAFVVVAAVWGSVFLVLVGILLVATMILFCLSPAFDDLPEKPRRSLRSVRRN